MTVDAGQHGRSDGNLKCSTCAGAALSTVRARLHIFSRDTADFFLTPGFQCAAQLTVGLIPVALFVLIPAMRFNQSCLSATLFIECSLLGCLDNHVGTKLLGCAAVWGAIIWGATLGGITLSLSLLAGFDDGPHMAVLLCLSAFFIAVMSINRVGQPLPFVMLIGAMVSCLGFGLVVMLGQFQPTHTHIWRQAVGSVMADAAIGAAFTVAAGLLVLPSLATDELRSRVATTLRGVGKAASRYATLAFQPEQDPYLTPASCLGGMTPAASSAALAQLAAASTATAAAGSLAADSAATDSAVINGRVHRRVLTPSKISTPFPSCASFSHLMSGSLQAGSATGGDAGSHAADGDRPTDGARAAVGKTSAASASEASISASADAVGAAAKGANADAGKAAEQEHPHHDKITTNTNNKDSSNKNVLMSSPPLAALRPLLARARACMPNASMEPPWMLEAPFVPADWARVIAAADELLTRVAALECIVHSREGSRIVHDAALVHYFTVDIVPLFRAALSRVATSCVKLSEAAVHGYWARVRRDGETRVRIIEAHRALLRSRVFQSGVKYALALSTVLLLILGFSERHDTPEVRHFRPLFGFVTCALSMSERVEATVSRVSLWVLGTVVGIASSYPQFRMAMVLTLITFASVSLCQYTGTCGSTGSAQVYGARLLSVMAGCSVPVLLSQLILPWYTSDWALQTMGRAFSAAAQLSEITSSSYTSPAAGSSTSTGHVHHLDTHSVSTAAGTGAGGTPGHSSSLPDTLQRPHATAPHALGLGRASQPLSGPASIILEMGRLLSAAPTDVDDAMTLSLVQDVVLWTRGPFATPPVVAAVLRASQALVDQLAALGLVAGAHVAVDEGGFSGWAFEHIIAPLNTELQSYFAILMEMAAAAAAHLALLTHGGGSRAQTAESAEAVMQIVERLHQQRLKVHNGILELRRRFHAGVRYAPEHDLPHLTAPDDAMRTYAFIFALAQVADKATVLARLVAGHRDRYRMWQ
eukprot:XP_001701582.1 predicted protein [Chlamydomonas reinhardtii]